MWFGVWCLGFGVWGSGFRVGGALKTARNPRPEKARHTFFGLFPIILTVLACEFIVGLGLYKLCSDVSRNLTLNPKPSRDIFAHLGTGICQEAPCLAGADGCVVGDVSWKAN